MMTSADTETETISPTAPHRTDFFAVGPQRTGSTWLYRALCDHRSIAWPAGVKETFFFDDRYDKGLPWYQWHFRQRKTNQIRGEVGPTYFDVPIAAERIRNYSPRAKIIINVRNPIEKTYSVFLHFHKLGKVPGDFSKALRQMPRLLDCGRYEKHCKVWEDTFSPGRVMYVVHEDIKQDPQRCLDQVTEFLAIEPTKLPFDESEKINAATSPWSPTLVRYLELAAGRLRSCRLHRVVNLGKRLGMKRLYAGGTAPPKPTQDELAFLAKEFESDIAWLERRLERDFSVWRPDAVSAAT